MGHMIEQHNGKASFVSARESAWHRLGTVLPETFDADTALEAAYLKGWDVRKHPLYVESGMDMNMTAIADKWATVRTNPHNGGVDYLGVVGGKYTPIQNEDHIELLNALVDESGAHFETAGSLKDGREVFVSMKMPNTMQVGGSDPVDTYIAALNSHDGRSAFKLIITPIRIVCANTQAAALRAAQSSFTIRHTRNHKEAVAQARQALGLTWKYMEAFELEAERMIQEQTTRDQFAGIVDQLIGKVPEEGKKAVVERAQRVHDDLENLFLYSDTNTEIRGTRWAAYQAFTEYADFYSPVRSKTGKDDARALKVVTGELDAFKSRAFDLCTV